MDGRKVYVTDSLDELIESIKFNLKNTNDLAEANPEKDYRRYISRDENLLKKIDTYKKTDSNGGIYFYFFPKELEDLMWLLLENNILLGGMVNDIY